MSDVKRGLCGLGDGAATQRAHVAPSVFPKKLVDVRVGLYRVTSCLLCSFSGPCPSDAALLPDC